MDPNRREDLGEMYSPDNQGEYTSLDEAPRFSMQRLSNALVDIGERTGETPAEEYAMMEVMMADHPGRPHPPTFSWNTGMVMHVLKSDLVLRELEHVQVDGLGIAYLFFYNKQGHWGLGQDAADAVWTHVGEAFSEWISHSAHFTISLFPLMEAWQGSVAASHRQRLRGRVENPVHNTPVVAARESDSSSQLVGSAPQQAGRASGVGEVTKARLTTCTGAARQRGRPLKFQCTTVGRGSSPPSSPDRGAPDSDGYSTVSETAGCWHRRRGSRERKWLVPARLDMPIFKSTDPGVEVTYTLWLFDVDAFLEQYDEASMHPHSFASLRGYPSKWARKLDEGKDISVWDLLMHMEKTFGNKRDYDAMIRTLYEVQQRDDKTVEEYMLHIHEAVAIIRRVYPERLPDRGWDLKKYCFYHGLCPYLHDALSFAMAELPEREQAHPTFDTLYTLAKKLEARQLVHTHQYTSSSEVYREKHRHYPVPAGRVALTDPVAGKDSKSEVEAVGGLNVHLAQAMSCYQREEQQCFVCGLPGHFARGCPHHDAFRRWHHEQANYKGAGEISPPTPGSENTQPEVNVCVIGQI